jgi:hypothetical protein
LIFFSRKQIRELEFANIGSGVGGGFENTKELKVMNHKEAVNGPDGMHWQAEVENEYQQMVANKRCLKWCCAKICQRAQR